MCVAMKKFNKLQDIGSILAAGRIDVMAEDQLWVKEQSYTLEIISQNGLKTHNRIPNNNDLKKKRNISPMHQNIQR